MKAVIKNRFAGIAIKLKSVVNREQKNRKKE